MGFERERNKFFLPHRIGHSVINAVDLSRMEINTNVKLWDESNKALRLN